MNKKFHLQIALLLCLILFSVNLFSQIQLQEKWFRIVEGRIMCFAEQGNYLLGWNTWRTFEN
jgi:hypothetical protein